MKIFQVVVFVLTIANAICNEKDKRSTGEELQNISLNRGEYYPSEEELREYDSQYGVKNSGYYSPQQEQEGTQFTIIKRTKEVPTTKKIVIANPIITPQVPTYAALHQTKIMPVKVIREGPVKHVYLPQYYTDQSAQIKSSSRSSKAYENLNQGAYNTHYQFNGYNPGHQQNYFTPSVQYQYLQPAVSGLDQGIFGNGYNNFQSGYRVGKSNEFTPLIPQHGNNAYPNGFETNLYNVGAQYAPQGYSGYSSGASQFVSTVPSYQNGYPHQQLSQFSVNGAADQFKSLSSGSSNNYLTNQYSQPQRYTSTVVNNLAQNQQSYNSGREPKLAQLSDQYKSLISGESGSNAYFTNQFSQSEKYTSTLDNNLANNHQSHESGNESKLGQVSGLDPELANIVNDVINNGKGYPTHDGFTMIKSKTDNAIYLIGKPGMSLGTIPNLSAYNFASFQKDGESAEQKTEEKKET